MKSISQIKEQRFTTAARILTGQELEVRVVKNPTLGVAWTDCFKSIWLNEANPRATSPVEELILDRGKFYHELDHCEFHRKRVMDYSAKLRQTATDKNRFQNINNALLDGHGEHHGGLKWEGQTAYIRATLKVVIDVTNPCVFSGLLLFVRLRKWRNQKEAAYWQPYEAKIVEAITTRNPIRTVDIAYEIAEAITAANPKPPQYDRPTNPQPPKGEDEEENEGDNGEPREEGEESPDDSSGGSDSSEDENEAGEAPESEEGDSGEESDEDSGEESDEDSGEESDEGANPVDDTEGEKVLDSNIEDEIESEIEKAKQQCENEAADELDQILSEYNDQVEEQQFMGEEEQIAFELEDVLRSVMVERNQPSWTPVKRCGRLDSRRLVNTVTGGTFLKQRDKVEGCPRIALLLDCSGSMRHYNCELTASARVLNGAMENAGIESLTLTFHGGDTYPFLKPVIDLYRFVPVAPFDCFGGTPTHAAMERALQWLRESAQSLMVIVTDGSPDDYGATEKQYQEAAAAGCRVLMVTLGKLYMQSGSLADEILEVKHVSDLPRVLQPVLENFARG